MCDWHVNALTVADIGLALIRMYSLISSCLQNDSSMLNLSNLPVRSLFSPSTHPGTVVDSHSTNPEEEGDPDEEEGDQDEEDRSPYMYYWNDDN